VRNPKSGTAAFGGSRRLRWRSGTTGSGSRAAVFAWLIGLLCPAPRKRSSRKTANG